MTSLADRTIAALRANHDSLASLVPELTDEQLHLQSGATDWRVHDVLSHMGSAAEIGLAGLNANLTDGAIPDQEFNQSVWDRWNALAPRAQADGFLASDRALVEAFEALDDDTRQNLSVKLGFVPFPLPIAAVLGMRLNEALLHHWDVAVALDPAATLDASASALLFDHLSGDVSFLIGFVGKAQELSDRVAVDLAGSGYGIVIDESVAVTSELTEPTAEFHGPLEAVVRLIGGRLTSGHTPAEVSVTGNVTLDDLRRVFPGY